MQFVQCPGAQLTGRIVPLGIMGLLKPTVHHSNMVPIGLRESSLQLCCHHAERREPLSKNCILFCTEKTILPFPFKLNGI